MAHFAGSGPPGMTCGDCAHKGYYRTSGSPRWNAQTNEDEYRTYRSAGCAMFKALTGHHGPAIESTNRSCKYFERNT
jgi:hypothetical protein